ncbi:hypothetical protein LEMLEM_LOCUS20089 [Lemmus lemmus]
MTLLDSGGERLCEQHRTSTSSLPSLLKPEILQLTVCPSVAGAITTPSVSPC